MSRRQLDEPTEVHSLGCRIWVSPDPLDACDCGADAAAHDQRNPRLEQPTLAQRLDRLHPNPVPLACDDDQDEAAAS